MPATPERPLFENEKRAKDWQKQIGLSVDSDTDSSDKPAIADRPALADLVELKMRAILAEKDSADLD